MNERIRKLAEQAGAEIFTTMGIKPDANGFYETIETEDHRNLDIEKFAELIVQECIASIQNVDGDNPDATLALVQAENAVRKHFGVK